mmetsp:Transcript_22418/g.27607  ORF Transcript_22418/g.27607 Transcript_22418/m.27607 type:complete len:202 (-) Transcript_22418:156-761(-)|eukprot:CAMPEP_0170462460 /NCGR_PEP_ID=MMETSP0123-20130129/7956_1 /TAXON_ID=182087 /ORGANISM="Favella ehrenbergii, Strain Fehren 1" /LENGTH=201 /DNA_ID=CAMNT_0010727683 /DNA_START=205 /DNA_END=810 /DNA_ORIENTATION=+
MKTSAELAAGDSAEMFICYSKNATNSFECIVSSLVATNPTNGTFTLVVSAYIKTSAKPASSNFTTDKSFISGTTGFNTGSSYSKRYSQTGAQSSAGSNAAAGTSSPAFTGYSYPGGNKVNSDKKTINSSFTYSKAQTDAMAAKAIMDAMKTGAASSLQGVYLKTTASEKARASNLQMIVSAGALSQVAAVGAAIAALAMAF